MRLDLRGSKFLLRWRHQRIAWYLVLPLFVALVLGRGVGDDSQVGSQSRKPSAVGSTRAPCGRIVGRSRVCSSTLQKKTFHQDPLGFKPLKHVHGISRFLCSSHGNLSSDVMSAMSRQVDPIFLRVEEITQQGWWWGPKYRVLSEHDTG